MKSIVTLIEKNYVQLLRSDDVFSNGIMIIYKNKQIISRNSIKLLCDCNYCHQLVRNNNKI